jgi:hypothetical protein
MNVHYHFEFYYQTNKEQPHKKVSEDELVSLIGQQLFEMIWDKVHYRTDTKNISEVVAFFERGGRQLVAVELYRTTKTFITNHAA